MDPAEPRSIHARECDDCRIPFRAMRANARRCAPCSFLAKIAYARSKRVTARRCNQCAAKFAPLHIQDRHLCAACTPDDEPQRVVCALCKEVAPAVDLRVKVCITCAKDPAHREQLLRALNTGKASRTKEYASAAAREQVLLKLWRGDRPAPAPLPAEVPEEPKYLVPNAKRSFTRAELAKIEANPAKSATTKQQARDILATLP